MTVSQFFILSPSGDVLLSRNFRNESTKNIDRFYKHLKERGDSVPLFELDGMLYFYIRRSSLYFVITTKYITSPSYVFELLQKITNFLKDFIGLLNEESIKNNFILAYEILDEILDYGYAQCLDINQLKQKIYNTSTISSNNTFKPVINSSNQTVIPSIVSNKSLINPNNKNEIFIDILEKVTAKMSAEEMKYTIEGQIQVKSYLKGFPTIELFLNRDLKMQLLGAQNMQNASSTRSIDANYTEAIESGLESVVNNCTFDESADISSLEREKVIKFVPKEGEYTLMTYRVLGSLNLPFKIMPTVNISENKCSLSIKVVSCLPFDINSFFLLTCKLPSNIKNITMSFHPKSFNQGYTEVELNADITFTSSNVNVKQFGPINMMFEIPLYNVSDVKIDIGIYVEAIKTTNIDKGRKITTTFKAGIINYFR
ncbi:clathrin-coat assembly protein [Theileria orientalis strain Shintoku]|uniref:Clathrin-coat assembly protein n=1 Tax=Theileria orientalis strain Shintoku TaxID=869250 RepID=J4CD18_THEOR|nr:clathrin-coat assembly protein [Theileria orientalis strain Shintoku]BAM40367.1 clathrin-coat assembly protein [Theileria orientalis strain Shintoku]|eukprot:XP_009690668.1 clathrin-coat assembly protein [Theileria orientalis strain Shintoku]